MNWLTIPAKPEPDPGVIEFDASTWADLNLVLEAHAYLREGRHLDRREHRGRHD